MKKGLLLLSLLITLASCGKQQGPIEGGTENIKESSFSKLLVEKNGDCFHGNFKYKYLLLNSEYPQKHVTRKEISLVLFENGVAKVRMSKIRSYGYYSSASTESGFLKTHWTLHNNQISIENFGDLKMISENEYQIDLNSNNIFSHYSEETLNYQGKLDWWNQYDLFQVTSNIDPTEKCLNISSQLF